jgi:hypothetical protein
MRNPVEKKWKKWKTLEKKEKGKQVKRTSENQRSFPQMKMKKKSNVKKAT